MDSFLSLPSLFLSLTLSSRLTLLHTHTHTYTHQKTEWLKKPHRTVYYQRAFFDARFLYLPLFFYLILNEFALLYLMNSLCGADILKVISIFHDSMDNKL